MSGQHVLPCYVSILCLHHNTPCARWDGFWIPPFCKQDLRVTLFGRKQTRSAEMSLVGNYPLLRGIRNILRGCCQLTPTQNVSDSPADSHLSTPLQPHNLSPLALIIGLRFQVLLQVVPLHSDTKMSTTMQDSAHQRMQ